MDKQQVLFLSRKEIEEQAQSGKVGFGNIYSERKAEEEKAVHRAVQCFEDGMIRVYQNDRELKSLDEDVLIQEGDTFTLIRLSFLAGRMW